jgi:DNA-binding transcriptional regulator YhcF (GntR family)
MSSTRRKNRKGGDPRHVRLYTYMTRTPAWKSLSGNERATYLLLAERYVGLNNGKIPYSVREVAAELQVSLMTASRCLERLQQCGFIVAMVRGAFSLKRRHATEWRLTEHVCNVSGHGPSGEYRDWRPEPEMKEKIQNTVSVVVSIGICGGTDVAQKTRDGICGGTVNSQKSDPQYHQGNTLSYQVPPAKPAGPMTEYAGTGTRRYLLSDEPRAFEQFGTVEYRGRPFLIGEA